MNTQEALDTLKSLGTEQNRKIYRRHGAGEHVHGVSFAHLKDLKKKIKTDHELAVALWESGNHDARMLAGMIADPAPRRGRRSTPGAQGRRQPRRDRRPAATSPRRRRTPPRPWPRWIASDEEWTASAGWASSAGRDDGRRLPRRIFRRSLATIERDLHGSQNRVRHEMNNALIAIGIRNPALAEKALAAAAASASRGRPRRDRLQDAGGGGVYQEDAGAEEEVGPPPPHSTFTIADCTLSCTIHAVVAVFRELPMV